MIFTFLFLTYLIFNSTVHEFAIQDFRHIKGVKLQYVKILNKNTKREYKQECIIHS